MNGKMLSIPSKFLFSLGSPYSWSYYFSEYHVTYSLRQTVMTKVGEECKVWISESDEMIDKSSLLGDLGVFRKEKGVW